MPAQWAEAASVASDGKMLLFGGYKRPECETNRCLVYDPDADAWHEREPLPACRFGAAAAVDDRGDVFLVGGQPPVGNAPVRLRDGVWSDQPAPARYPGGVCWLFAGFLVLG